tara:strand:- start:42 stop:323 length:282 start_codon:yes stop_codon:yes gene_type:complete
MNKKKLKIARKKIDQLDRKIFNLIKQRTKIVLHMMNIKRTRSQIVDHKRINVILKSIKKRSLKEKVDAKTTVRIWKSMIWSYVDLQRRMFKKK